MVTVEPQITEGRVAHTGSAFLLLTVTAPTDVCLNWALIHGEITSPLKSPPNPPSPPKLQKYPSLFCYKRTDWDTESSGTLRILSAPPSSPLAVTHRCDPLYFLLSKLAAGNLTDLLPDSLISINTLLSNS